MMAGTEVKESKWLGRDLDNYKEMHRDRARDKGLHQELMACATLTQARKVVFGEKAKKYEAARTKGSNK